MEPGLGGSYRGRGGRWQLLNCEVLLAQLHAQAMRSARPNDADAGVASIPADVPGDGAAASALAHDATAETSVARLRLQNQLGRPAPAPTT